LFSAVVGQPVLQTLGEAGRESARRGVEAGV